MSEVAPDPRKRMTVEQTFGAIRMAIDRAERLARNGEQERAVTTMIVCAASTGYEIGIPLAHLKEVFNSTAKYHYEKRKSGRF